MEKTEIDYARKWFVMVAVSMGTLLATIDSSNVNVALPTAALHEEMGKYGALPAGIKPFSPEMKVCGTAVKFAAAFQRTIPRNECIGRESKRLIRSVYTDQPYD